ncbi:MAG: ribonuclease HIII [Chlamydiae bacterium RIFCSPHIGHO2_12_FULL_27_8]|nr:MAG: ribonuclease HIII [Chlamydiae bacterium RIFCSPHIGHO2_12_FULL_27_8]
MSKPPTFTTKIDLSLKDKLLGDLKERDFEISKIPYSIFSAKKKNLVIVLYESGSLVVQGKDKEEFIEFYLEPEILKTFEYSNPEINISFKPRIGVDEAGKGDFFGPLCIGGVYADEKGIKKLLSIGVKDSKRINDKKILDLAKEIKNNFEISLIRLFPKKYNELYLKFKNLNFLLAWGHISVITNLNKKTKCQNALIDQFAHENVLNTLIKRKKLLINLEQRTKAESDPVVAAASIIARAGFLKGLEELSEEYEVELPKGASSEVIKIGKKIVSKHGPEILEKIAKIHFKTTEEIKND